MSYREAMDRYGIDKPDTRFGMEIQELTDLFKASAFKVFAGAANTEGSVVRAINAKGLADITQGELTNLETIAKAAGAKGLAFIKCEAGEWKSPSVKFFTEEEKAVFRSDPGKHEKIIQRLRNAMLQQVVSAVIDVDSPEHAEVERLCQEHLDTVRDPDLRRALTPGYRAMCKRLVVSGDFYEAIQQPNARLVTDPIERIESAGVRTRDGALHELDVLVLATGFQVNKFIRPTIATGRNGANLDQMWTNGPIAYLSVTVPDFPNFFMLNGPNGPVGNFSLIEVAERQLDYTLQLIDGLRRGVYREVSPTLEAMHRFENERREAAKKTVWVTGCNSWYLDADGVPASWTFSHERFVEEMSAPKMADFDIR
jgi:hypothetical protein